MGSAREEIFGDGVMAAALTDRVLRCVTAIQAAECDGIRGAAPNPIANL